MATKPAHCQFGSAGAVHLDCFQWIHDAYLRHFTNCTTHGLHQRPLKDQAAAAAAAATQAQYTLGEQCCMYMNEQNMHEL
jgi:hypothetical protein